MSEYVAILADWIAGKVPMHYYSGYEFLELSPPQLPEHWTRLTYANGQWDKPELVSIV